MRREVIETETPDGLTLRLNRVRPDGDPVATIFMLHGLSSNGRVYDMQEQSLAAHLAGLGMECFIADLRGAGISDHPKGQWGLDEYVSQDLPTLLKAVLDTSSAEKLMWVGHSMGGILLFFHMMENPDAPISRAVTLGTAFDYGTGGSIYGSLHKLLPLARPMGFLPYGTLSRLVGKVAGRGLSLPPESMNFHRANMDPALMRKVLREGFHKIPMALFEGLATTFSDQGFQRDEGRIVYGELRHNYQLPTLFVGGTDDGQAPRAAVEETARLLSSHGDSRLAMFGQAEGHAADYGHFDLIVGRNAPDETWPVITDYLRQGVKAANGSAA